MKRTVSLFLTLLIVAAAPAAAPASAAPLTRELVAAADTWISSAGGGTHGGDYNFTVGVFTSGGTSYSFVGLVRPDLSSIPPGSEVVSAELRLTVRTFDLMSGPRLTVEAHALTRGFSEEHATWTSADSGVLWSHPGGDYESSTLDSFDMSGAVSDGDVFSLDVTDYIREVMSGDRQNYGIALVGVASSSWARFYSREAPGSDNLKPRFVVTFNLPNVTVTANPAEVDLTQGESTSVSLNVGGSYTGLASVSADWVGGAPDGASLNMGINSGYVPLSVNLRISTSPDTPSGDYEIRVRVQSLEGSPVLNGSTTVEVHVSEAIAPNVSVTLIPDELSLGVGGSADASVSVVPVGGFSSRVSLSVVGLPSGVSASFSPSGGVPPLSSTLTISASQDAAPGDYPAVVRVRGGGLTAEVPLTVHVVAVPEMQISLYPTSVEVARGGEASLTVEVTGAGGFASPVTLTASGVPPGVAVSFSVNNEIPVFASTAAIEATDSAPEGTYTVTVRAVGGGLVREANFTLTIVSPASGGGGGGGGGGGAFDFNVSVSPASLSIPVGGSGSVSISVTPISGEPANLTLSASGLPPDASHQFSPEIITPPGTASMLLTAGQTPGTYTVVIRASGGGVTRTATLTLEVQQPAAAPSGPMCVIATAAYGSELAPEVQELREFRDGFVASTYAGARFMDAFNAFYYSWSPPVARVVAASPGLAAAVRAAVGPLLWSLEVSRSAAGVAAPLGAEVSVVAAGLVASLLIGLIYLTPLLLPATLLGLVRRWERVIEASAASLAASAALLALGVASSADLLTSLASAGFVLSAAATSASLAQEAVCRALPALASLRGRAGPLPRGIS